MPDSTKHNHQVIATLHFEDQPIDIIDHDGEPWVTAADLAKALGYSRADTISRLYRQNADEFTSAMHMNTETVFSLNNGGFSKVKTRIFSPRGCHLIAMLARTKKAKLFRKWVLDVLEHYRLGNGNVGDHFDDEPESSTEIHVLSGSMPVVVPVKVPYLDMEVVFTYVDGRFWINGHQLGLLVGYRLPRPARSLKRVWQKYKHVMAEDGSRLTTWSVAGRTSGERVFDLPTAITIAEFCFHAKTKQLACCFLNALHTQAYGELANKLSYSPESWLKSDWAQKLAQIKSLNNLLSDHEMGERAAAHEVIDDLIDDIYKKTTGSNTP